MIRKLKEWINKQISDISWYLWYKYTYQGYYKLRRDAIHEIFSAIGIEELEDIVKRAKENQKNDGHSNYVKLADIYFSQLNASR